MHIPDNYLSPSTCAILGAAMIPIWMISMKKVKKEISPKRIPLLGISAAFSFLIMMFNIPLIGGTSGHAVGATLVALLVGPFSAVLSLTVALVIQALVFGDGGVLSIGANCFNMAFIAPFVGYYVYIFLKMIIKGPRTKYISAGIGAYIGINVSAFVAAIEFGIQPILFKDSSGLPMYCPYPLKASIPAMTIPHLLIVGVLEAVVTMGVFSYLSRVAPDIIEDNSNEGIKSRPIGVLILIMIVLCPVGLLTTSTAWGEWGTREVGKFLGYVPKGIKKGFSFGGLIPDYSLKGVNGVLAYMVSALFGVAVILIVFKLVTGGRKGESNSND